MRVPNLEAPNKCLNIRLWFQLGGSRDGNSALRVARRYGSQLLPYKARVWIDLLLPPPDQKPWPIEIKRSLPSKFEKGFHLACTDLQLKSGIIVCPGPEAFSLPDEVTAMSLLSAGHLLPEQ